MTGNISYENLSDSLKQKLRESNTEIVNDLTIGGADKALSAEQGKVLDEKISNVRKPYGVEVINENHAILRLDPYNGWTNDDLPEVLYIAFNHERMEVEGEFTVRATIPKRAGGFDTGSYKSITTVRSINSETAPWVANSDNGIVSISDKFAQQFYGNGSVGVTDPAPINRRPYISFIKIKQRSAINIEIELFTANGKAKEILESYEIIHRDDVYNSAWTLPPQKSAFDKARNAITEANTVINVTVSPLGNDLTGEWNNAGKAFKTIQGAINSLPKYSNHALNVRVLDGTYEEWVQLNGFTGAGTLTIQGGSTISDASKFKVRGIQMTGCSMRVDIVSLHFHNAGIAGISIQHSQCINVSNCNFDAGATGQNGVTSISSILYINSCNISNRGVGIQANYGSTIFSAVNTGSGNSIGLVANSASTIGKSGTQPLGTTPERVNEGSVIR